MYQIQHNLTVVNDFEHCLRCKPGLIEAVIITINVLYRDMCFHRVHGRNARLSRNRLTASRATVYSEFNDAVLFSSRPLRECDMFELRIDKMVDCWIGSIEIGSSKSLFVFAHISHNSVLCILKISLL